MNLSREQLWQYAEDYVYGRLNDDIIYQLNQFIHSDDSIKKEWLDNIETIQTLKDISDQESLKSKINSIHTDYVTEQKKPSFLSANILWIRNVAAVLVIVISSSLLTALFFNKDQNENQHNEFISLKRDIQNIKNSQEQLKLSIDSNHSKAIIPQENTAGTGFAITNDGYIVTDYHVIDKADSVYIKVRTNEYKKAFLVAFDLKSDIALLKIEDNQFRFTKSEIPFHLSTSPSPIAQSIYSIGYPQDNIFYSEGYISSHTGVNGSKVQYQLELPAHPGQSGSPIFDHNGEIIGMLLGKKTYATYAVISTSILELIKTLPKEHKIKLTTKNNLKNLPRTEQVKKANDYVFPVLVFKS